MSDYAVVDPATGETLKTYPTITDDELQGAIGRAYDARSSWADTPIQERAAIIGRVGALHDERKQELAEIITREMGKPIEQAVGEVEFSGAIYQYYAENGPKLLEDEAIELLDGEGSAFIRRTPVGVLLGIMPWNYPYYQVARFAGPNLVIGNTILLKHAPQCPESSAAMEKIFHEAGVPTDAYTNIYATNDQISTVIADKRVQGISLTGSGRAGAAVAEQAGRHLKKVVLELGGSDPFLVLKTDDLDAVVESAVGGRLENGGQACNAAKRFIVADDLYDSFLEKFSAALTAVEPGDPKAEGTAMGPLSSSLASDRLEQQVQEALDAGATLVAGGGREGNFFKTAVITGVTKDNPAYGQEFFGPVAQVYKAGSEDEAIALANDTPYGLGSYVFTNDSDQALRVADKIEAGMVFINAVGAEGVELPFGGVKQSGFGRELGRYGADEFVNKKLIRVAG
ncbi:NAD-dependent succinate-semialdehyde dehydrogenase [Baekduia sp. Peel2402]|uniref:NAD-dependent succinate-semialdehyde dehydrogenase n=1 Tax=Baekduia sp. Peel2402 TaxID=3458296 RepID=UPI00403E567E